MAPTPKPETKITKSGFSPGSTPTVTPEAAKPPEDAQNPFGPRP